MKQHKHLLVLLLFIGFAATSAQAQLKLGNNPSSIASTSLLELESDSLTFVLPRMSTANRNAINGTPLEGSLIYNTTTNCVERFNGTSWACLVSSNVDLNIGDDNLDLASDRTLNLNGHELTFKDATTGDIMVLDHSNGQLNFSVYGNVVPEFYEPQPAYILGVNSQGDVVELYESDIFAGGVHWDSITNVPADIADGDDDNQVVDTFSLTGTVLRLSLEDDGQPFLSIDLDGTFATNAQLAASDLADEDKDSTNEIQTLTSSDGTVGITGTGIDYDFSVDVQSLETTTSISYNATTHVITYVDEDTVSTDLTLGVGTLAYDSASHTMTYTAENGTTTALALDEGSLAYVAGTNTLTYTDASGDAFAIDLNESTMNQDSTSGVITHTDEAGNTKVANVTSTDAGNDASTGSDGGTYIDVQDFETLTTVSYDAATHVITYVDEDTVTQTLTLDVGTVAYDSASHTVTYTAENGTTTALALDEGSLAYDVTNNNLTYTDASGDDYVIDLNESFISQDANGDITHTSADSTTQVAVINSTDALNDISSGSDKGNFLDVQEKETTTFYVDSTSSPLNHAIGSYTNEDTVNVTINETLTVLTDINDVSSFPTLSEKDIATYMDEAGDIDTARETVTSMTNTNTVTSLNKHEIATYVSEDGTETKIKESVIRITYDDDDEELEFVDEDGNDYQIPVNMYGRNGDLTGNRFVDMDGNKLTFENNNTSTPAIERGDLFTFEDDGELELNKYINTADSLFYDESAANHVLTVTGSGDVRQASITDLETTTSYNDSTTSPNNAIGSYEDEDGNLTTINENVSEMANTLATGNKIGDYTDEAGVNTVINETVTSISYDATTHEIDYVDENGDTENLDLNVGELAYDSATHTVTYTDEEGISTALALDEGSLAYATATNTLTYTDASGDDYTIDLNESNLAQSTTTGVITHTDELGGTQTANVVSTDALNDVSVGSDGGAFVDVQAEETLTTIAYDATTHVITYVDEDTVTQTLTLDVGVADYDSASHTLTYTAENGTVTTMAFDEGSLAYATATNTLTYTDASGDDYTIDLNESSIAQNTTTGVITHTDELGGTQTANVVSTDALNDVSVGSDGGAFVDVQAEETLTTIAYDATTHVITYVDEDTVTQTLTLDVGVADYDSASHTLTYTAENGTVTTMAFDEGSLAYATATNTLTYTDASGDDYTIDLNESSIAQATNGDITHTDEIGGTQTAVINSTDADNDISSGSDNGNYLNVQDKETLTFYSDSTTSPLRHVIGSYTDEDTVETKVYETLTVLSLDQTPGSPGLNRDLDYRAEDGTVTSLDFSDLVDNLETVTQLEYDDQAEELEYTDEDGNTFDLQMNIYSKSGDLQGDRIIDFNDKDLTFQNSILGSGSASDIFTFNGDDGELELNKYDGSTFYDGSPANNILTVTGSGAVREANITDLETTTTYTNFVDVADTNAIGSYVNEDGSDTTVYETVTRVDMTTTGNKIARYTNETGTSIDINETVTSVSGAATTGNTIGTYNDENGGTTDINETVTSVADNNAATSVKVIATYTDENGNDEEIEETVTSVSGAATTGNTIGTYNDENGGTTNINETVTSVSDDNAATSVKVIATYTDENGNDEEIEETVTSVSGAATTGNTIGTYNDENGGTTNINETVTSVSDDNAATSVKVIATYTDENGNDEEIEETVTSVSGAATTGNTIGTYNDENGGTTNINETVTVLALNADDTNLDYTDENGTTTQLDFSDLVDNLETVTDLSYNSTDHELDYTDEDGTVNNIDLNVGDVTNQITGHKIADYTDEVGNTEAINETVTSVSGAATTGNTIGTYNDENGGTTDINETVTVVADNNAATSVKVIATYTDENGNDEEIEETVTSVSGAATTGNTIGTYNDENGGTTDINETVTVVADNNAATSVKVIATYTDENGNDEEIEETVTSVSGAATTGNTIGTYNDENGGTTDINETVTSITGALATGHAIGTYNDEEGNPTIIRESISTLTYDATSEEFVYTDENGNTNDFYANIYGTDGDLLGDREINLNGNHLTIEDGANDVAVFEDNGSIDFSQYGSGTFTGTPAYNLGVDASGNVIEIDPAEPTTTFVRFSSGFTTAGITRGTSFGTDVVDETTPTLAPGTYEVTINYGSKVVATSGTGNAVFQSQFDIDGNPAHSTNNFQSQELVPTNNISQSSRSYYVTYTAAQTMELNFRVKSNTTGFDAEVHDIEIVVKRVQ